MRTRWQGFTLLELLCVMAIVAILSSLALPSYQHSQSRSQRTLAKLALVKTAHWMERQASMSYTYPSTLPATVWQTPELRYRLQLQTVNNTTYVLIAIPVGAQAQDACGNLTLNSTGEQGVQNASLNSTQCWGL
jgi:type IV pilus assembly protein PilE